ncbi:carbamoyltransferase C-terminal domain-containing protein [Rhizobacter sp. OV335]|uniref:carbamoyltransferase family protein n=1 Tax=Rhizobacter sp. OV335 TaxID=1500264 RepID=UPI00090F9F05|nr:carbamoyltransferase C-terminal domain-containing protein [Rhizobacter sp. OV335]SHM50273.1 carbamoyltransferase [Rhizobacter sp. OV335]
MITLGINAAFHDSAAVLVADGIVVAAAEEERFTRIKHAKRPVPFSAWELPFNAIDFCLKQAGATLAEVDHVAYSYDPMAFLGTRAEPVLSLPLQPSAEPDPRWENPWDPLFAAYIVNAPRQLAGGAPHHLRKRLSGVRPDAAPYRWHFVSHHVCHQASAFLAAPFARCAVMTLDGRGEQATTCYGRYRDSRYEALGEVVMPNSLGLLYEQVTAHLGFLRSSDEYKVMALAALGMPRFASALRSHLHVGDGGQYTVAPIDLTALAGPPRVPGTPMTERDLDLAASLQDVLEETVLSLARWLREASGERQLAMAGGVALNCVMNSRLRDSGIFDAVWVQPAAGDAGTALGAALWADARERRGLAPEDADGLQADGAQAISTFGPRRWQMDHAYLGPGYDDAEIESLLRWAKLRYHRADDLAGETARLLAADRIIGWFQGRMEFGPRALGARSILASPIDPAMQARLNELKDREDFRPVAPALPQEDLAPWFAPAGANDGRSPFMLFVYDLQPGQAARIPSACHTDRTARVQTVDPDTNPRFHALLKAFGALTGVPVLVNTSFNVRGEPIVCTPRAAIEAFASTPLDALVIGSFIVRK